MHRFFSMLAEASRARFSLVFRRFSLTQSLSPIKVTRLVNKMAVARTIIKFSAVRSWRTIAILSAVALVTTTVNAQFTKDPSYPDDCKQNSDNPSSAYECKRINPDEAPYKNQWRSRIANGFPDNTYFDAFTDSPEEGRDLQLVAINAEQVRLQADYEAKGFNGIGYIYRFIIDPMNPQCTPPYVD